MFVFNLKYFALLINPTRAEQAVLQLLLHVGIASVVLPQHRYKMGCLICSHPERQIGKLTWVQVSRKLNYQCFLRQGHYRQWCDKPIFCCLKGDYKNAIRGFLVYSFSFCISESDGGRMVPQKVRTCSVCLCHQQYNFFCYCLYDQIMELNQGVGKLRVNLLRC